MQVGRIFRTLRSVREECAEAAAAEESASFELAVSARRFSSRTRDHVDDKLNFSATLMRAGEVDAAHRLLAEFERDVRTEEAELFERVGEVRVAQAIRRERITRLRLLRMLAVAVLGAATLATSAVGMAVAGMFADRAVSAPAERRADRAVDRDRADRSGARDAVRKVAGRRLHKVRIAGVEVILSDQQLATYRQLVSGSGVDDAGLQDLLDVLPAPVVDHVREAIAATADAAPRTAKEVTKVLFAEEEEKKREGSRGDKKQAQEPADEPATNDDTSGDDSSDDSDNDSLVDDFEEVGTGSLN